MQVNKVNTTVPKKLNNIQKQNRNIKSEQINNKPSFKGISTPIDKFSLFIANAIENGGLFVSFTLQDMLGTNLPRPLMGLMRNSKENNGEINLNFAAKEVVREFMTGPSMFLIPMGMLAVGKKFFGKLLNVPADFVKSMGELHAQAALKDTAKAASKEEFYKTAFSEIIKNAKSETVASNETLGEAKEFVTKFKEIIGTKNKKARKELLNGLTNSFTNLSKQYASDTVYTDFTSAKLSEKAQAPFKTVIGYIQSYADDVVEKVAKKKPANIPEYIKKITTNKTAGRFAQNILMYAAVLTFLQIIPKLYNKAEGDDNAGLKGLMKEETFDRNAPSCTVSSKNSTTARSNPSFGSGASVIAEKITDSGILSKFARGIEFDGPNVSFPLLLGIMGFGILLPRTLRAKDKYDREEILRRDLVTCAVMCFGEKELRKGFSKVNEVKSGLVLSAKDKAFKDKSFFGKLFDYLRPIKGVKVLSTDQIVSKYTNIDGYKNGIKGFCDFISNQGGNLGKLFGLNDQSKEIVNNLLKSEGKNLTNADNSTITNVLDKAKDSEAVKKLANLFKDKDNPWVKKAKTLNARFTTLSVIVLVPFFLGFLLPWINEKATKKRINEEQAEKNQNSIKSDNRFNIGNAEYLNGIGQKNIFSEMTQF